MPYPPGNGDLGAGSHTDTENSTGKCIGNCVLKNKTLLETEMILLMEFRNNFNSSWLYWLFFKIALYILKIPIFSSYSASHVENFFGADCDVSERFDLFVTGFHNENFCDRKKVRRGHGTLGL